MKFYNLISIFSLATTAIASSSTFSIFPDFRVPKNVMFNCLYGGSSHVSWVIDILDELSRRGHTTFYLTTDDQVKFSKNHPSIITESIGMAVNGEQRSEAARILSTGSLLAGVKALIEANAATFSFDYLKIKEHVINNQIDLLICDSVNRACIEAATSLEIEFVVTSSFPQGQDTSAPYINNDFFNAKNPTTEFMSLKDRIIYKFINPVRFYLMLRSSINGQNKILKSLGVKPVLHLHTKYKDNVKLINTAFGFEQGRPLGPLVEFVGPILPKSYSGLTPGIEDFLSNHKRVAYIAFGQHIFGKESDGTLVLTGLLESLESKHIDGIIWATRGEYGMFPPYIITSSNTTYDIQSFRQDHKDILFLNWAPQMAILHHSSTHMFVTHGGAGSLYESSYAGVPVVVYPFFNDQFSAAVTSEKNGIGLFLNREKSQSNANNIISRVAKDVDGQFQFNMNRFKALTQIKSERGVARGADIMEEVLFVQKDGKVEYRMDVKRNMTFFKAHNIDLYTFVSIQCTEVITRNILSVTLQKCNEVLEDTFASEYDCKDSLKLVRHLFAFESSRLEYLVDLIATIMNKHKRSDIKLILNLKWTCRFHVGLLERYNFFDEKALFRICNA
ncbi:hypothetical protein MFLAVUS_004833 [Mucor flavus]|uniref:UDP-Glycosyltransferase/glycogen phosphorylase n=1 Tax=Mucor flavus TaxID=439312 RepID=A0ABP9YX05_9FUNG